MALNPYINSFDTQEAYEEYLDGSTAKAPNVAYIRATDEMKYTKTVPNPSWLIYGTTSGTTDFYIGADVAIKYSSASNGIHLHVDEGKFYATAEDVVGRIVNLYEGYNGFGNTEGKKITKLKRWTYSNNDVTLIKGMFKGCGSLTSVDLSSFNTDNTTNSESMFEGCSSLTSIDFSNFNTSKVTTMMSMFSGCQSLASLDLSSFDTSNVTNMSHMVRGCTNLTSLDLSNFNTANVSSMNAMFWDCQNLSYLNISSFDTTKVTEMTNPFYNCTKLYKLILGPGFFNSKSLSTFNLSQLSKWTDADSLETFVKAAEVHDGTGKTIQLSSQTKNALTQGQKDRITGAGWTLSL